MQLFYNPHIKPEDISFSFDKEESKHIVKVLRKKRGDMLHVTNGLGYLFSVEIIADSATDCRVKIVSTTHQKPLSYQVHLAVAPTKMNDRYEWFLEKATEIGISEITPIICKNSERTVVKTERFQKIIESAMKQSLHYYMPKLNEAITFNEFVKQSFNGQKFIAHCEETDKKSLKNELKTNENVLILIGPEGDFTTEEITMALEKQFLPISLGNTRLRTETAAVVACHSVAFLNQ